MLLSPNKTRTLFRRIALFIMLGIGATGAASLAVVQVWDGGFHQAEFRLRFVDAEDRPVSGVTLLVTDALGQRANCYPVSDFHEGAELQSDEGGILTFHHVGLGPEYSGRIRHVFFLIPIGKRTAPIYYCRFYRNGDLI